MWSWAKGLLWDWEKREQLSILLTGRSVKADDGVGSNLEIARLAVEKAGGSCIPIQTGRRKV